jgi:CheY-like chemotaxis protein
MRIAYVEDNPTNLALVERVANIGHHSVVPYSEGEIAAQELLREKFDLILMDVELAGEMGGLAVVRKLREGGLQTPIIAVTAYAMMGDREKCIEAGCNDYLPKPLPINDLLAMLAKYDAALREPAVAQPVQAAASSTPIPSVPSTPLTSQGAAPVQTEIAPAQPPTSTTNVEDKKTPETRAAEPAQPADSAAPAANVQPSAVKTEEPAQPVANPGTNASPGRDHTE